MVLVKQSLCAFRQPILLVNVSTFPHQLPLEASQLAVGVGAEELLVVVGIVGDEVRTPVGMEVGVWVRGDVLVGIEVGIEVGIDVRVDGMIEEVEDDSL
jgi:hypothetical protein